MRKSLSEHRPLFASLKPQPTNDASLPIPFHWWELVLWPHLDTEDPGRCSFWLGSCLAATTSHCGIGRADCGRQTDISDSQLFLYFFHFEKKGNFLLSPRNYLGLRWWHGNLSSFFWVFSGFLPPALLRKNSQVKLYIYLQCTMWWSDIQIPGEMIQVNGPFYHPTELSFCVHCGNCFQQVSNMQHRIVNHSQHRFLRKASPACDVWGRRCFPTNRHICEGPTTGGFHQHCYPPHANTAGSLGDLISWSHPRHLTRDRQTASAKCQVVSPWSSVGRAVSVTVTQFCHSNMKATMETQHGRTNCSSFQNLH